MSQLLVWVCLANNFPDTYKLIKKPFANGPQNRCSTKEPRGVASYHQTVHKFFSTKYCPHQQMYLLENITYMNMCSLVSIVCVCVYVCVCVRVCVYLLIFVILKLNEALGGFMSQILLAHVIIVSSYFIYTVNDEFQHHRCRELKPTSGPSYYRTEGGRAINAVTI